MPLLLRQVNTDKLPQLSTIAVFIESGQGEQFSLPRQSCCVGDEIIRTIACWDKFSAEQSGMRMKRRPKLDAAWRWPDRVEAPLAAFQRYKRAAALAREFPITLSPFTSPLCGLQSPPFALPLQTITPVHTLQCHLPPGFSLSVHAASTHCDELGQCFATRGPF